MITAQEVFDTVVNGLRKQGTKCMDCSTGICFYRRQLTGDKKPVENCLRCAAGMLIEDAEYNSLMEYNPIFKILNDPKKYGAPDSLVQRLFPHSDLIVELQSIHDRTGPSDWEAEWQSLATAQGLIYTPLSG